MRFANFLNKNRQVKLIRKRLNHPTGLNFKDQNLMKAINCRVTPAAGYVINVCHLGKGYLDELDSSRKWTVLGQLQKISIVKEYLTLIELGFLEVVFSGGGGQFDPPPLFLFPKELI